MIKIIEDLSELRIEYIDSENQIHEEVKKLLTEKGYNYSHEFLLGKGNRVDFYIPELRLVIEIKKKKPNRATVLKQVTRYLNFDNVDSLVLLSERTVFLPSEINGKEVTVMSINRLWF